MRRPRPRGHQNNHILLFDQAAILSSRPALSRAGARSGRQGWPQATAQRLVLDGREHDGTIEADRTTLSPLTPWPAAPMSPSHRRIFAAANTGSGSAQAYLSASASPLPVIFLTH